MMQIIVLLGKSCSGKTIIQKKLAKFGFMPVASYTTRPPGQEERNGVGYHFVSDRKFYQLYVEGFFVESKSIKTHNGDVWHYGTALNDIAETSVVIGNFQNIGVLSALHFAKPVVFYIDTLDDVIYERLKAHHYTIDEIQRKMVKFGEEFVHVKDCIDYTIMNDGLAGMGELAQQIYEIYEHHISNKIKWRNEA